MTGPCVHKDVIIKKLEFLEKKKQEYISQVVAINGAIQCLEEILITEKEEEKKHA